MAPMSFGPARMFRGKPPMRRRTQGFRMVKKPLSTSYIETGGDITLAAGTTANYSMLLASDSPDKSIVTNLAATVAQCENNSKIGPRSFIQLGLASPTGPATVTLWVYMNAKGTVVAPANGYAFSQGPVTLANANLRAHTLLYRRVTLSAETPRNVRLKLSTRRNNYLSDGSILVLSVTNPAATAVTYNAYGRLHIVPG